MDPSTFKLSMVLSHSPTESNEKSCQNIDVYWNEQKCSTVSCSIFISEEAKNPNINKNKTRNKFHFCCEYAGIMSFNKKFCFEVTVQSLARILAQIKPTPWEKVRE